MRGHASCVRLRHLVHVRSGTFSTDNDGQRAWHGNTSNVRGNYHYTDQQKLACRTASYDVDVTHCRTWWDSMLPLHPESTLRVCTSCIHSPFRRQNLPTRSRAGQGPSKSLSGGGVNCTSSPSEIQKSSWKWTMTWSVP